MKWRDLLLTLGLLLFFAPYLTAQTMPLAGGGGASSLRLAAGTASAPSLSFQSSTNSGMFDGGSGTPTFTVAGTPQLRIQTNQVTLNGGTSLVWSSGDPTVVGVDIGFARRGVASLALSNGSTGAGALQLSGSTVQLGLVPASLGFATTTTTSIANVGEGARVQFVCGTNAGTLALVIFAGKGQTDYRVIANNMGAQVTGC